MTPLARSIFFLSAFLAHTIISMRRMKFLARRMSARVFARLARRCAE
jgi:hypothetical protein